MKFFLGRDGRLSVIRIGSVVAGAIVLFFAVAGVWFYADQASRRRPLDIALYGEAEAYGTRRVSGVQQQVFHRVPLDGRETEAVFDEVSGYYSDRLDDFQRRTAENMRVNCNRSPAEGTFPDYAPGQNLIPYQTKCMFDRSSLGTVQRTQVTIQPGLPEQDLGDYVLIIYDQEWTR